MSGQPTRLIATTLGEPALKVGDGVPIKIFYQEDVIFKDGQPVPIAEAHNLPDPNKPTHVVQVGTPASPELARPEKWSEIISKLFVPCKAHRIYPVPGNQFLALAKNSLLGIGKITIHCPDKGCKYYCRRLHHGSVECLDAVNHCGPAKDQGLKVGCRPYTGGDCNSPLFRM